MDQVDRDVKESLLANGSVSPYGLYHESRFVMYDEAYH